jgi:hypothetical protein
MREGRPASDQASRYARRIERRWSALLDKPIVLSPRDWRRIAGWHERGIPFEIVEEAMIEAVERDRRKAATRRLADLVPLVEEAWTAIVDGRRAASETGPDAERGTDPDERWERRAAAEPRDSPLGRLLHELVARRAEGETATALDRELDHRLPEVVDRSLRERVEREIADEERGRGGERGSAHGSRQGA